MNEFIIELFSLSLKASWAVLAVFLLRFILRSAPKWTFCLLWAVAALRLLPFSVQSMLSLIPNRETVEAIALASPLKFVLQPDAETAATQSSENVLSVLGMVWIAGAALMLIYALLSYLRMYSRVSVSLQPVKGLYICDDIDKPFILGILKPRICLPSGMPEDQMDYVIRHERAHIKRGDHIWKPLSFLLAVLHWFNPVLWLAYKLFGQDVEMACDEATIKDLDNEQRRAYSNALLTCGMGRKMRILCPVAFGEVSIQERVVSVLSYRKRHMWRALTAVAVCFVLAVCFLTDPVTASMVEEVSEAVEEQTEGEDIIIPSVNFSDSNYVFAVEDNISIRDNGIAVERLKCCPEVSSSEMEISYTMARTGYEELWCKYGNRFHSHRAGHIYAVVRCKNCGSDLGSFYVGRGYYCEFAGELLQG